MDNQFAKLAKIDVGNKIERKGRFNYLSWSYAVEQLMQHDPKANWVIHEPRFYGQQVMVSCTVTAFDKPIFMWLPVMNNNNQAINNPSVTDINKAQMRCLVKAIACHGLGLYIYAGEDLPIDEPVKNMQSKFISDGLFRNIIQSVTSGIHVQTGAPYEKKDAYESIKKHGWLLTEQQQRELEQC